MWRSIVLMMLAFAAPGCAKSYVTTSDGGDGSMVDGGRDGSSATDSGRDAFPDAAGELPRCPPTPPFALRDDDAVRFPLHSSGAEPFLLGMASGASGLRVVWQEVGTDEGFVVRGALMSTGEVQVTLLASVRTSAQVDGNAVAAPGATLYGWSSYPPARSGSIEWFLASESDRGVETPVSVATTLMSEGVGNFDVGPAVAVVGDSAVLTWVSARDGLVVGSTSGAAPVSEGRPAHAYGRISAGAAGRLAAVSWSEIQSDGYARAMVALISDGVILQPPRAVMTGLSGAAAMVVAPDAIWVAGFTRIPGDLRASRSRIIRLSREDLTPLGAEGAIGGWGGGLPIGLSLVYWRTQVWAVWLADDIRYGALQALFIWPVPSDPCLASDVAPLRLLDADLRGADTGYALRVSDSGDTLWVGLQGRRGEHGAAMLRVVVAE